ncbi:hypothetical protein POTOM_029558 [Populus tomentosa]|uniref:Uncharacterized protein n=1 Tax=Populus tomentosa TaxID=118781 RepID=A0A8X7ZFJ1_POPTO|nr:hypothetical protein POTOM_029558 [Populus tomentosa]
MASIKIYAIAAYVCVIIFHACKAAGQGSLPKFPAILIFGDSTVDTGNNNYINTLLKANFSPYGQNYPGQKATGRFSDGELVPDMLASALKIKEAVPPFLDPNLSDAEVITGVSFASAGAGYDYQTNTLLNAIPVPKQIDMFRDYIARLEGIVGEEKAKQIIGGAFVLISAGSNDILTRPFNLHYSFQDTMLDIVQNFTKELHGLGCRSMAVAGLPPVGYAPIEKTIQLATKLLLPVDIKWVDNINSYAQSYNKELVKVLAQAQATFSGSKIVYADVYEPLDDMVKNPERYGFVETKRGCCGTGLFELGPLCGPTIPTCGKSLASKFLFWDAVHPSTSTYRVIAKHIEKEVFPKFL